MPTRRAALAAASSSLLTGQARGLAAAANRGESDEDELYIAAQEYPWKTWADRAGEPWPPADLGPTLDAVKAAGCDGWEPLVDDPAAVAGLLPLLAARGLGLRSIYMNATLHDPAVAEAETNRALAAVDAVRLHGCRVLTLNPTPIRWGGDENKSDGQLRFQATALERLARAVSARGLLLAYHVHDAELRAGAREFHHMLASTDPAAVRLCLDAHWVYRGCEHSAVAALDAVRLYGHRTAELHLRNSVKNVWTESFGPGDLDHAAIRRELEAAGVKNFGKPGGPVLVLEQAIEAGTAVTMTPQQAHAKGRAYAAGVFG